MRNEPLHAYSLHQRPFQEKRSIYYLFTYEYGVLHGIAKKGIPQFVPLTLFATGKKPLKTLQQIHIQANVRQLIGQQQYAALYINEITLKLLPIEEPQLLIYAGYKEVIQQLQQPVDLTTLKLLLRRYEQILLSELGFAIDLYEDTEQNEIVAHEYYRYIVGAGWQLIKHYDTNHGIKDNEDVQPKQSRTTVLEMTPILGEEIIAMRLGIKDISIKNWSLIHRYIIDYLFEYKPLHSRRLWQQFHRYQSL